MPALRAPVTWLMCASIFMRRASPAVARPISTAIQRNLREISRKISIAACFLVVFSMA
jgi:hypothetical protein